MIYFDTKAVNNLTYSVPFIHMLRLERTIKEHSQFYIRRTTSLHEIAKEREHMTPLTPARPVREIAAVELVKARFGIDD